MEKNSAVDTLRNIVTDTAIIRPLAGKDGRMFVSLPCNTSRTIVLDIPENSLVVNMHSAFPKSGRTLTGERIRRLRCDYVIVGAIDNERFIAFIEANNASLRRQDTENRLRVSVCLMDYCASIAREFYDLPNLLDGHRRHFVKVRAHRCINRRFNYQSRLSPNNSPENLRILEGRQLPLGYIIA
jgi:hypothetical protein